MIDPEPQTIGPYKIQTLYTKAEVLGGVTCYQVDHKQPALQFYDAVTYEPIMRPTVMLEGQTLADNECFIKDYSENEGIADCMVKLGLIEPAHKSVSTGFVTVGKHKMKGAFLEAWNRFKLTNKELLEI